VDFRSLAIREAVHRRSLPLATAKGPFRITSRQSRYGCSGMVPPFDERGEW
jgi:hypothetical protein